MDIGYKFSDHALYMQALSHRSVGRPNNERLEFFGDALLSMIISEALFDKFPEANEGQLTRLRASLVKGETLAELANEMKLGKHLLLGEGERKSGGCRRTSILADALEALICAIYLEAGMAVCKRCILSWFEQRIYSLTLADPKQDPKTQLQEFLQAQHRSLPDYVLLETQGAEHECCFVVECRLPDNSKKTKGTSHNKRTAEKQAAQAMLKLLGLKQGGVEQDGNA